MSSGRSHPFRRAMVSYPQLANSRGVEWTRSVTKDKVHFSEEHQEPTNTRGAIRIHIYTKKASWTVYQVRIIRNRKRPPRFMEPPAG
ncbi:hypothetical protein ATCV1_z427L [Acanthocystis turfacea chlorella virus 1]|uniref:Uncharacterized protein z427L n=1 Tax=Chlorovirus heliozoae TaxID=322019 RepID=A7K937_9PHYC|nr:hypothetical protein ATCV1_z427L [Acanthocystis turfacea chlorella virus 1]ABT16561.1 hypothetical protein ATCV1_z427L [Acanthocystis turfacea chlorella virus 1]